MSDTRTIEQKLACLFDDVWSAFIEGGGLDGFELQEAIERTGLAEWRECTEEEAFDTDGDYDPGDRMLFLTDEGNRVIAMTKDDT